MASNADDPATAPRRQRRTDAALNVERLLAAARELFDESGPEVALDEVARRAGVGNATLYRHFPTRGDLLVAVYADEVAALCRRGTDLLAAPAPLDALFSWLDDFVVHVATKRALALSATDGLAGRRTRLFDNWHRSICPIATELVDQARVAGTVRSEVTATDLLAVISGATLTGTDVAHARRLVRLLRRWPPCLATASKISRSAATPEAAGCG